MSSFPINIYFSQKVTGLFTFHNSFTSNLQYTIHIYTRVHIKTIILHSSMCSFQTTNTYTSNRGTFSKHKHKHQHLKFESQIFTPVNIDLVLRCIGIHNVLYWIVLLIKMNKREQDSTFFLSKYRNKFRIWFDFNEFMNFSHCKPTSTLIVID